MKLFVYCMREYDEKEYFDEITNKFRINYEYTSEYPNADNVELAKGCDAVSLTPCDMGKDMLRRFYEAGVRCIAARSIGYDHIDLSFAKELGMKVSHVAYAPDTVADYSVMLMLMCCRRISHILNRSLLQDYTLKGKIGKNLGDCTVGIIGTGKIGRTVIQRLQGFGCRILAYDIFLDKSVEEQAKYVSLDTLLEQSDIISLHTPSTNDNYHMLNQNAFNRMKNGVIIVNTARGALIDTDAIIEAIENGKVGQAALDVLEQEDGLYYSSRVGEPIQNRQMAVLRAFPNVLLTPHTAFYTDTAVYEMAWNTVKGAHDMMNGIENPLILLP